jgi:hypothetical protein
MDEIDSNYTKFAKALTAAILLTCIVGFNNLIHPELESGVPKAVWKSWNMKKRLLFC